MLERAPSVTRSAQMIAAIAIAAAPAAAMRLKFAPSKGRPLNLSNGETNRRTPTFILTQLAREANASAD